MRWKNNSQELHSSGTHFRRQLLFCSISIRNMPTVMRALLSILRQESVPAITDMVMKPTNENFSFPISKVLWKHFHSYFFKVIFMYLKPLNFTHIIRFSQRYFLVLTYSFFPGSFLTCSRWITGQRLDRLQLGHKLLSAFYSWAFFVNKCEHENI